MTDQNNQKNMSDLPTIARIFVEADLTVSVGGGGRFQPTGFPNLGPALYRGADGKDWLLVESAQSMANRMERVCWADGDSETDRVGRYNEDCAGIPYVAATDADNRLLTASPLEAHRLASPYIWDTQSFEDPETKAPLTLSDFLTARFRLSENRLVPWKQVAETLLAIDPACLLHGIWFNDAAFAGGKVRITRALSGYIEASAPSPANFGFQKRDPVSDRTDVAAGQTSAEGYGSVIGPKQHFTSSAIKAYFQIDVERLRSYGLDADKVKALVAWAFYKIRRVLSASRDGVPDLRTECKFEAGEPTARCVLTNGEKTGFDVPQVDDTLKNYFQPLKRDTDAVLTVRWVPKIEGKAELPESFKPGDIKLKNDTIDLTVKAKIEKPAKRKGAKTEPRLSLILSGEWLKQDKENLLKLNEANEEAKKVCSKALKDYEKNWVEKAQGTKSKEEESEG